MTTSESKQYADKLTAWIAKQTHQHGNAALGALVASGRYFGAMHVFNRACLAGDDAAIREAGRVVCEIVKQVLSEQEDDECNPGK